MLFQSRYQDIFATLASRLTPPEVALRRFRELACQIRSARRYALCCRHAVTPAAARLLLASYATP